MEWQNTAVALPIIETESPAPRVWPNFDHDIGLTEAREMINRWKRANPEKPHAAAVTKEALDRILSQKGCVGGRFYYALNPNGSMTLILVGVDVDGNDMDEGALAERFQPCPPFCAIDSALNV